MKENKKIINIICDYAAAYSGNFIPSILMASEAFSSKFSIIFSFPIEAKEKAWCKNIAQKHNVFYFSRERTKTVKDLRNICKRNKVNIIYTHFLSDLKAKLICPVNKHISLIIHIHSDFNCGKKASFRDKFSSFVCRHLLRTDATYYFVSKPQFDNFSYKNKFYIPNSLAPQRKKELGKIDNDEPNKRTLLLFGWSPYVKGVDIACKALQKVNKCLNEQVKLLLVVNKINGEKKCKDFLLDRGIKDFNNVIFENPREDISYFYDQCDCLLIPSRSEAFSYAALESMYLNKFLILSNLKSLKWAEKYNNIRYFESESVDDLSNAIFDIYERSKKKQNSNLCNEFCFDSWLKEVTTHVFEKNL